MDGTFTLSSHELNFILATLLAFDTASQRIPQMNCRGRVLRMIGIQTYGLRYNLRRDSAGSKPFNRRRREFHSRDMRLAWFNRKRNMWGLNTAEITTTGNTDAPDSLV